MTREELIALVEEEVRERGGEPSRRESNFRCPEPAHHADGDAHASARWNNEKKTWWCPVGNVGGGYRDLARRLGLDLAKRLGIPLPDRRPAPTSLPRFAESRRLPLAILHTFDVRADVHQGRPALRYATPMGVDRVKFLDDKKPKYTWAARGGRAHWYGLDRALGLLRPGTPLYIVNGEPSVWACHAQGVAGICVCAGEGTMPTPAMIEELHKAIGSISASVRAVYDADAAGRDGARKLIGLLTRMFADAVALDLAGALPGVEHGDVDDLHRKVGDGLAAALAGLPPLTDGAAPWVRIATVEREEVVWLWAARIPRAKLTMIEGDPGQGKSTLTLDLAARVSTGRAMPFAEAGTEPAGVVILSAEDGLADTIRPRLEEAGADLDRVVAFRLDALPSIPAELATVEAAVKDVGAALVIVDPLMAFLGDRVESYKDHHVRRALAPLAALAERTGAAVVVVRHLTKGTTGAPAMYRGGGSIGFAGAARSVLLVAPDPDDDTRRVLAPVKCNLSAPPPPLAFSLVPSGSTVRVQWHSETAHTAEQLLAQPLGEERSAVEEAKEALATILAFDPVPAREVLKELNRAGIPERAWRRAKQVLGVRHVKLGFLEGWAWTLPATARAENGHPTEATGPEHVHIPGASIFAGRTSHDAENPQENVEDGRAPEDGQTEASASAFGSARQRGYL